MYEKENRNHPNLLYLVGASFSLPALRNENSINTKLDMNFLYYFPFPIFSSTAKPKKKRKALNQKPEYDKFTSYITPQNITSLWPLKQPSLMSIELKSTCNVYVNTETLKPKKD